MAWLTLGMSTLAYGVCFACWVMNSVLIAFLLRSGAFSFDPAQVGWLLAAPILTGVVFRIPLGMLADRYGGRIVLFSLMLTTAALVYAVSLAQTYPHFLLASLGFGLTGSSFSASVSYVSGWFPRERQGTAFGVLGVGTVGAVVTVLGAPQLLAWFTANGALPDNWRFLPRVYAGALAVTAVLFFALTRNRGGGPVQSLRERLAPLRDPVVWRLGLYYLLFFGAFVATTQWLVLYVVNVYSVSIAQAGAVAAAFGLPAGALRSLGGWLSDRYGARAVMYRVFFTCIGVCAFLAVPRLDIDTPGAGVVAEAPGAVASVSAEAIVAGPRRYAIEPVPSQLPGEVDGGSMVLPRVTRWQRPVVAPGERVEKDQLVARGVTNLYYPANLWVFALLLACLGAASGVGAAAVLRFIPDQFPGAVSNVTGTVALIGGFGGVLFPPLFGYLLNLTGIWTTCWMAMMMLAVVCLAWMHVVILRILREEAPALVTLIERRPSAGAVPEFGGSELSRLEDVLKRIPLFRDLGDDEIEQLAKIGHRLTLPADSELFRQGDSGSSLYVLLDGEVRLTQADAGGRACRLIDRHPGDFIGELALLDGEPRSAGAVTTAASQFFVIERRPFLTLLARSPRILANVLIGLSGKLREVSREAFDLAKKEVTGDG